MTIDSELAPTGPLAHSDLPNEVTSSAISPDTLTNTNPSPVKPGHSTVPDGKKHLQHETRACRDGKTRGSYRSLTPEERKAAFWDKVDIKGPNDCWDWIGAQNEYGLVTTDRKLVRAHRIAYQLKKGPIPEGLVVRHTCDRKICVNPAHLLVGTNQDNVNDAIERGLFPRGERSGYRKHPEAFPKGEACVRSKLKEADLIEIHRSYGEHWDSKRLADRFNVTPTQITRILDGKTWKHLKRDSREMVKTLHRKNQGSAHRSRLDEKISEMRLLKEQGLTYDAIAAKIGCSRNAVWTRIR